MTCPSPQKWHLLSLDLLTEREAAGMYAHAEECARCRKQLGQARQDHAGLLRAFEVFDRNHDQQREQLVAALPPEPVRLRAGRLVRGSRRIGGSIMSIDWKISSRATAAVLAVAACLTLAVLFFISGEGQSGPAKPSLVPWSWPMPSMSSRVI